MKTLPYILAAAIAMTVAASCQKETPVAGIGGNENVTISIEIPDGPVTKAVSEADNIDIIYYEIWTKDWGKQLYPAEGEYAYIPSSEIKRGTDGKKTATLEVSLIADQTYEFIFWAQNKNCEAYTVMHLDKIKIDYNVIAANGNEDKFDAFYATHTLTMDGSLTAEESTITLKRPFAQLNFGASRMNSMVGEVKLENRYITVSKLSTAFNTIEGVGYSEHTIDNVIFKSNKIMPEKLVTNVSGTDTEYTWISMDYMLMPGKESTVTVNASFNLVGFDNSIDFKIGSVPLKQNYRTNIVGDLFTEDAQLIIVIEDDFIKPDNNLDENGNPLTGGNTTVNP